MGTESSSASEPATLRAVRRFLAILFVVSAAGTVVELLLLEHTEDLWQWTPLGLLGLSIVAFGVLGAHPTPVMLRITQGLMLLVVASGGLGVFLHLKGNVEFEKEMYPAMAGFELMWESLKGATPSLAPGAMALLGLVGLVFCHHHPAFSRRPNTRPS